MRARPHERHAEREHQLLDRQDDQEALAVDLVRQQAAHHGQDQGRAQLGEDDDADERGRVREVVGVGAEDDVLHPGADVGGEGAEEDDAEGPVREGRPGRAGPGRERACPRRRRRPRSPRWRWSRRHRLRPAPTSDPLGSEVVGRGRHPPIVREALKPPLQGQGPAAEQRTPQGASNADAGARGTVSTEAAPALRCTW